MAFDLDKLARISEFTIDLNSMGHVLCVSLTTQLLSQAEKRLAAPDVQSRDFVRWLFAEIARHPIGEFSDPHDPEKSSRLTAEELKSISDEEFEQFAGVLVQKNRHPLLKTHKADDIEKSVGESARDFLLRAFRHYVTEHKAQLMRLTKSVSHSLLDQNTFQAMQSSALEAMRMANRYVADSSVAAAIEGVVKRRQEILLVTEPLAGLISGVESSVASTAFATNFRKEQDLVQSVTKTFRDSQNYLEASATSTEIAKAMYRNEDSTRAATGGLKRLESASVNVAATFQRQLEVSSELARRHTALFRLPAEFEAAKLLDSYRLASVAAFAQRQSKINVDWQRTIDAVTSPWIHTANATRSVTAMLELQGIGSALRTMNGFDLELTAALRLDFGDWRDKITFPEMVFIDPVARTDFYVSRGFDDSLTDFPDDAFQQSLDAVGLDDEHIDFEHFGYAVQPSTDPEEEAGLKRTNKCHDRLQRFERELREFVDRAMTVQYGSDWPRKRLDPTLYEQWEFKRKRAAAGGVDLTFIEFADFTDYETIICKRDHWREVFEVRFKKKESVRESLQRLQPIRVAAMHARIVTREDELYLVAEVMRLRSAIK